MEWQTWTVYIIVVGTVVLLACGMVKKLKKGCSSGCGCESKLPKAESSLRKRGMPQQKSQ